MDVVRVLVTGSQDWPNPGLVWLVLDHAYSEITGDGCQMMLVHGDCQNGADAQAQEWADHMNSLGLGVMVLRHPADWKKYKKAAGHRRNAEMVKMGIYICLAFIRNRSNGASHTASLAIERGIETYLFHNENGQEAATKIPGKRDLSNDGRIEREEC